MTDWKYDKVIQVNIGYDDTNVANYAQITNVVSFASRVVSPDGDLVDPLSRINDWNPAGVHQNHKYWELELTLDTNWRHAAAHNYWAYYQDIDGAAGRAIDEDGANDDILYFAVFIREYDGTITKLVYTYSAPNDYGATNVLWCTGETSEISNETGVRHQTVTFKFIALLNEERTSGVGAPTAPVAPEAAGIIKRINHVRTGGVNSANILSVKEDFIMKMTPRFIPNLYEGQGMKQDEKYRIITVVVDSETDIFDTMFFITAAQAAAGTDFLIEFTMDDAAGGTETWTYQPGSTYMINRREGTIEDNAMRSTIEYEFISYGTKGVA